jgi:hypothetical protein
MNQAATQFETFQTADIRSGSHNYGAAAGWIIGAFQPTDALTHSSAFEIKEWNHDLVQREWRNHPTSGPEYVRVIEGCLRVSLSDLQADLGHITEIELSAGQCIILAQGLWRRFEASADAVGISVRGVA